MNISFYCQISMNSMLKRITSKRVFKTDSRLKTLYPVSRTSHLARLCLITDNWTITLMDLEFLPVSVPQSPLSILVSFVRVHQCIHPLCEGWTALVPLFPPKMRTKNQQKESRDSPRGWGILPNSRESRLLRLLGVACFSEEMVLPLQNFLFLRWIVTVYFPSFCRLTNNAERPLSLENGRRYRSCLPVRYFAVFRISILVPLLGCLGGTMWHAFRGIRNSPKGTRMSGMISAVKSRAPILGGMCLFSFSASSFGQREGWSGAVFPPLSVVLRSDLIL